MSQEKLPNIEEKHRKANKRNLNNPSPPNTKNDVSVCASLHTHTHTHNTRKLTLTREEA